MKVTNIRKNCMGTISFDAKLKGMRKPQDFVVYPNPSPEAIMVQSENRVGKIVGNKIYYCQGAAFVFMGVKPLQSDTIDNIDELLAAIRGTASQHAGTNGIVYCDNSTAANV